MTKLIKSIRFLKKFIMIKMSTKARYATRIIVYLAGKEADQMATAHEISQAEGISADYVEQILTKLRSSGLVRSRRGVNGGFALACDATQTTVADVLKSMEGPVCLLPCLTEECTRISICVTRDVWQQANDALDRVFSGIAIAELAAKADKLEASKSLTFQI